MGKRCFAQSTWIDSGNTMYEKKRKEKKKKKSARLKTQKGGLGKS